MQNKPGKLIETHNRFEEKIYFDREFLKTETVGFDWWIRVQGDWVLDCGRRRRTIFDADEIGEMSLDAI